MRACSTAQEKEANLKQIHNKLKQNRNQKGAQLCIVNVSFQSIPKSTDFVRLRFYD